MKDLTPSSLHRLRLQIRVWKILLTSHTRLVWENVHDEWQKRGVRRGSGRYRIRKVENLSAGNISRVKITAVLRYPSDSSDRDMVKNIVREIIKKYSKKWIRTNVGELRKKWGLLRHPKYIWVSLYRVDGTLRWLGSGGWVSGNLVAVAERIYGPRRPSIFVPTPEEIWKGIRFRYSMDVKEASKAIGDVLGIINKIRGEMKKQDTR